MRRARWLAPWKDSMERPVIYHCVTRVVERRLAFGPVEKEQFRTYLRMYENFSGCRVLAYCLMCNHVHLLLEVPPMKPGGLSDAELLQRLRAIYSEAAVAVVAKELAEARAQVAAGLGSEVLVSRIHERYTYRMHDLGEFMKVLLLRFSRWYNIKHERSGALWESRFKSVLVEEGEASKSICAYIDLNPVRAGIVEDPAEYRWSSYGEAMGRGARGSGKKACSGLVRALRAHRGWEADAKHWAGDVSKEYRMLLLQGAAEKLMEAVNQSGELEVRVIRKGMKQTAVNAEIANLEQSRDVALSRMLRYRIRYFTDGAVIGSRSFVDELFNRARERFGPRRVNGARKMRGVASAAAGLLWSARDLRRGV